VSPAVTCPAYPICGSTAVQPRSPDNVRQPGYQVVPPTQGARPQGSYGRQGEQVWNFGELP
jgi:hypothetical protein